MQPNLADLPYKMLMYDSCMPVLLEYTKPQHHTFSCLPNVQIFEAASTGG